jgi:TRAP-type C4-dicarboxylate transport system permease small subunit
MPRFLKALEGIVGSILAVIAALVIYQVAGRYLLGRPPSWTEEMARYLQVWLVLLAAPICLARGMHLSVDYLTPRLPAGPRRIVRTMVFILVGCFSVLLTVYGFNLLRVAALQVSPALGISMVWPYLALPVSGAIMTLVTAWLIVKAPPRESGRGGASAVSGAKSGVNSK